jgi:hypothetical protein
LYIGHEASKYELGGQNELGFAKIELALGDAESFWSFCFDFSSDSRKHSLGCDNFRSGSRERQVGIRWLLALMIVLLAVRLPMIRRILIQALAARRILHEADLPITPIVVPGSQPKLLPEIYATGEIIQPIEFINQRERWLLERARKCQADELAVSTQRRENETSDFDCMFNHCCRWRRV